MLRLIEKSIPSLIVYHLGADAATGAGAAGVHMGHQLMFHTRDGIHASSSTLQQMEEALTDKGFVRCNKGYLVNLAHVSGVRDGCAVVQGDKLLISRGRRAPFLDALADYVGGTHL